MKPSAEFLVTSNAGKRRRKIIWDSAHSMALDHRGFWVLERSGNDVIIKETTGGSSPKETGRYFTLTEEILNRGEPTQLPTTNRGRGRSLSVTIVPLKTIRPAYLPTIVSADPQAPKRPSVLFVFYGVKRMLVRYQRTNGSFKAVISGKRIFDCEKTEEGYMVTPFREEIYVHFEGRKRLLAANLPEILSEAEMTLGTINWGIHWWRMNRIPIPPALPPRDKEDEDEPGRIFFKRVSRTVLLTFFMAASGIFMLPREQKVAEKKTPPVTIALKQPKIVPKKPEPIVEAKPLPAPKPVAMPAPPKEKPQPKVAKAPPPPPPKAKAAPPVQVAQKPATPAAPPVPSAAQQRAKAQAQLASSLSFLSPSQNRAMANIPTSDTKATEKYNAAAAVDPKLAKSSTLKNMAGSATPSGPIDTRAARNMSANVNVDGTIGGKGKALNKVQGKVSLQALYDPNAGSEGLANSLSGKGIAMSGEGQIPESLIEKVLGKHVQKFQYCYEKALLTDAGLSGSVVMQWTIQTSGDATNVKVVKSQLNNESLHNCIMQELARIKFPIPRGGSVTIKYPLAFSSATL